MSDRPWSPDAKAFASWQFRWNTADLNDDRLAVERALGQMRYHWSKLTHDERREMTDMLRLPKGMQLSLNPGER